MIQLKVHIILFSISSDLLTTLQTMLNCIDNSGAAVVECVAVMRKKVKAATIGSLNLYTYFQGRN
jgi:ribosomal protein L14